jgi:glycosyltransferase involved in cell wall biosynthesis
MKKVLKIAIATTGRFHVLDLARELSALGHQVKFYSYVPKKRAVRFGLPKESHVSLLPMLLPLLVLERFLGRWAKQYLSKLIRLCADWLVCQRLQPCDVFIGMSGVYVNAPTRAKLKFGAKIYVERGSRHILSQLAILKVIPGSDIPSKFDVQQELATYAIADKVVIPSEHVRKSFVEEYGFPEERLFINPYGVDTKQFTLGNLLISPPTVGATAIFVGAWSLRKGADIVVEAIRKVEGLNMIHVGPITDYSFPENEPTFTHFDSVDQMRLPIYYHLANFFVLPSREEGLAMVQAQALGCGLPIVCTDRTGGADLRLYIEHPESIFVVEVDSVDSLVDGMRQAMKLSRTLARGTDLLGKRGRESLSWSAYGKRYERELLNGEF